MRTIGGLAAFCCATLLAQDPVTTLAASAQRHEEQNEHAEAIADYNRLIKLRPDLVAAYNHRASEHFKMGQIRESIADFDRVVKLDPAQAPYLWQRGIALYYAGRYKDGRKQFELHQTVNGNDVENAAWRYLCMARVTGAGAARAALMPIEQDARVPMMQIYALYKGTAGVDDVMAATRAGNPPSEVSNQRLFYAHLYIGLYYEAAGDAKAAREHISAAAGFKGDNYMGDVARVHLQLMK